MGYLKNPNQANSPALSAWDLWIGRLKAHPLKFTVVQLRILFSEDQEAVRLLICRAMANLHGWQNVEITINCRNYIAVPDFPATLKCPAQMNVDIFPLALVPATLQSLRGVKVSEA